MKPDRRSVTPSLNHRSRIAGKSEMSLHARSILAAMFVSFAVAFAVLWLQRRPVEPSVQRINNPIATASAQARAPLRQIAAMQPEQAMSFTRPDSRAVGATAAVPSSHLDGPVLPVELSFGRRTALKTVEDAAGEEVDVHEEVVEGIVLNQLDKPLSITILEANIPTQETSQAQIVLGRGMQKRFGTAQGLKMLSGDEITLRSASYGDLTQPIP